ncbi:GNAT family N-acetyltransferase [Leptolyngbya ohadii]|uniref:GNAT family N-acetyltransferase n=1 Tax=Leptolyngbya ohadii TaxID=1962290 RepID=UPI000B59FB73|nr:GNAT family N-acetyltransferase [Leptolyngbya ohadii]
MPQAHSIIVRPARSDDRTTVLNFCQHTWESQEDYIAQVWDRWMADSTGQILVAEVNGQPAAMTRVVQLSKHEGWWEALRVDPQYRGQGLVRQLDPAIDHYFQTREISTVRCCVARWNPGIPAMIGRRGYAPIANYQQHSALAVDAPLKQLTQLSESEVDTVWQFIGERQPAPPLFVSRGAKWQRLTIEQVQERLRDGKIWGYWQQQELQGLLVQSHLESADSSLWVGYLEGNAPYLPELLQEIKHLASHLGYPTVSGFLPRTKEWLRLLNQADYSTSSGDEFGVYEKQFSGLSLIP